MSGRRPPATSMHDAAAWCHQGWPGQPLGSIGVDAGWRVEGGCPPALGEGIGQGVPKARHRRSVGMSDGPQPADQGRPGNVG